MKSHTRQDNFRTLARHIKCSFLPVREESGLPVGLVEDEFTRQKQNEMFYISILFYVRDGMLWDRILLSGLFAFI